MTGTSHARTLRIAFAAIGAALIVFLTGSDWSYGVAGRDGLQSLGGGRYRSEVLSAVPAKGLSGLKITGSPNIGGQIILTTGPSDSVRAQITEILRGESPEIAAEMEENITVELRPAGNQLRLSIKTPAGAPWEGTDRGVSVDITMSIPRDWDVDIDARYFEYDMDGPFRDVVINTEFGKVKLNDVTRSTDVRGSYTSIELSDVRGNVAARTSYADLSVRQAIPAADRPVKLGNNSGAITVEELAGAVIAETQYAPIILSEVSLIGGTTRIYCQAAPVDVSINEFGRAQLDIRTSQSPVTLNVPKHLSARMNVQVGRGGTIHAGGLVIQTHADQLSRNRLEGICGNGGGIIDIEATGASMVSIQGM
ncbi:MAG: hypothetical protein AB1752_05805 [Candidatus Zixiibacteriota bacterium]